MQFRPEQHGVAQDPVRRGGRAAVRGHVEGPAFLAGNPGGTGRPDQAFVERLARDVPDFAAMPRNKRHSVERVGAMPGHVREPGLVVEGEVVSVVDRGDEFRGTGRVERLGVDRHAHEDFLRGGV